MRSRIYTPCGSHREQLSLAGVVILDVDAPALGMLGNGASASFCTGLFRRKKRHKDILMLAATATVGLAACDSSLAQISANGLDRLAIQLAETVNTVAGANGRSTEEFAELIPHREKPPWSNDRRVS
jgi:hypothetical protein